MEFINRNVQHIFSDQEKNEWATILWPSEPPLPTKGAFLLAIHHKDLMIKETKTWAVGMLKLNRLPIEEIAKLYCCCEVCPMWKLHGHPLPSMKNSDEMFLWDTIEYPEILRRQINCLRTFILTDKPMDLLICPTELSVGSFLSHPRSPTWNLSSEQRQFCMSRLGQDPRFIFQWYLYRGDRETIQLNINFILDSVFVQEVMSDLVQQHLSVNVPCELSFIWLKRTDLDTTVLPSLTFCLAIACSIETHENTIETIIDITNNWVESVYFTRLGNGPSLGEKNGYLVVGVRNVEEYIDPGTVVVDL
jgi:hypothetical protein